MQSECFLKDLEKELKTYAKVVMRDRVAGLLGAHEDNVVNKAGGVAIVMVIVCSH